MILYIDDHGRCKQSLFIGVPACYWVSRFQVIKKINNILEQYIYCYADTLFRYIFAGTWSNFLPNASVNFSILIDKSLG